ncbi:MAG: hypothetical protein H0W86_11180 [Armatimonadetes bacterium]|nr:hypothetical protein [Armatimonadota bacterium]
MESRRQTGTCSMHLFVHSSLSEACCQDILEAVASGLRCATTDGGNARGVIPINGGDSQLVAAIRQQLQLSAVTAPPSFEGRPFDNRVMIERYVELYRAMR